MSGPSTSNTSQTSGKSGRWGFLIAIVILLAIAVGALWDQGAFENDTKYTPVIGRGLFGDSGSEQLVNRLDAAAKAHGVCYGWQIDTDWSSLRPYSNPAAGSPPEAGVDVGSNLGAGIDPRQSPRQCPRWAMFTADYIYSSYDEEWTSVTADIETNLPVSLGTSDLEDAGITRNDLIGDYPDARLADAVGAVPMIVSEKGGARQPVPAAVEVSAPSGAEPAGPGAGRYIWMGVAGVLIAGGLAWIVVAAVRGRTS